MSLDLHWIKYFSWTETYFFGGKNPKLEKKVENMLERFFDPGKKPTYLQSHFTQSRAGDNRAQWKLLKLARKYTVQEKAKICICLFLSSPCTLLWTSKWTKSPCFEETVLRHLNRSRWDIIYFMIQRAEKKNLPLASACAIKLWQMRLSEGKYGWNLAYWLLLCLIRGASKTVESLRNRKLLALLFMN